MQSKVQKNALPEDLLPLTPAVFHILLALADEERHGYAIMTHVAELTDGQMQLGPGTLYGTLKRLLAGALIEESGERPDADLDDERRRYYSLSPLGKRVLAAEALRLRTLVRQAEASRIIDPEPAR